VFNLVQAINDSDLTFGEFIRSLDLPVTQQVSKDEIAKLWVVLKMPKAGDDYHLDFIILQLETELEDGGVNTVKPENVSDYRLVYKQKRVAFERDVNDTDKRIEDIMSVQPIEVTPFVLGFTSYTCVTDSKLHIRDIFDIITLSQTCPFAGLDNTYKIYTDTTVEDDWKLTASTAIVLKVKYGKEFSSAYIYSREDKTILIHIALKVGTSSDKILSNVVSVLPGISINETLNESVGGQFKMLFDYDTIILQDIISTNPVFSNYMSINEHDIPSKDSSRLNIRFGNDTKSPSITLVHNEETFTTFRTICLVNRSSSVEEVQYLINLITRLLTTYSNQVDSVVKYYKQFIPDFKATQRPKRVVQKLSLHKRVPELFVRNYSRKCQRPPVIVEEGEDVPLNQQTLRFPRDSPDSFVYTCNEDPYKYIGLQTNTMTNADKYPYIPCCFKTDRHDKNYQYIETGTIEKGEVVQQRLIMSNKILKKDQIGVLPDPLKRIFKNVYLRKGFQANSSSLLNCIMYSSSLEEVLQSRLDLSKRMDLISIARQSAFKFTSEELRAILQDTTMYMDPLIWIPVLEEYFDCRIYLFVRRDETTLMKPPNHEQGYYMTSKPRTKVFFVYEHFGSKSEENVSRYPRCELIISKQDLLNVGDLKDIEAYFNPADLISKRCQTIFNSLTETFVNGKRIEQTTFPLPLQVIQSQSFDSYGKTRQVHLKDGSVIVTDPMAPLPVPEAARKQVVRSTKKNVLSYISVDKKNSTLNILSGKIGNVRVYVKVRDVLNVIAQEDTYLLQNLGTLDNTYPEFINLRRQHAYLFDHFVFYFSNWAKDNVKNNYELEESIPEFVNNKIKVRNQPLSLGLYLEYKDGPLYVPNAETLDKLCFMLKTTIHSERNMVIDYYRHLSVNPVEDFQAKPDQIILEGVESLDRLNENINYFNQTFSLDTSIDPDKRTQWLRLQNRNCLLMKRDSFGDALSTSLSYLIDGYANQQADFRNSQDYRHYIYVYNSKQDITLIGGGEEGETHPSGAIPELLVCQFNGTRYYFAVIEL
jgi:hypothetical protein